MATAKWLNDNLCNFGELVRIERGPQVVELPCTDQNLSDEVTHPRYKIGARDALGRLIRPNEVKCSPEEFKRLRAQVREESRKGLNPVEKRNNGALGVEHDTMACVDRAGKHAPFLWKIYQKQSVERYNHKTGEDETHEIFVKVAEVEGKDEALKRAEKLLKGVKS